MDRKEFRLNLDIPTATNERLNTYCEAEGQKKRTVVAKAIDAYLDRKEMAREVEK